MEVESAINSWCKKMYLGVECAMYHLFISVLNYIFAFLGGG